MLENTTQTPSSENASWLDSAQAKLVAAAAAIAATVITARDAVSRAFFKTVSKGPGGAFYDLQETRERDNSIVHEPARRKIPVAVPDAPERIGKISSNYDRALRERKKLLGFNTVFDEAKVLKRHQWLEVVFATAAVASVAVGAIIAIGSSRKLANKQEEIESEEKKILRR